MRALMLMDLAISSIFVQKLIPYKGSDAWVEPTLHEMKTCKDGDMPPVGVSIMGGPCEYCEYARRRTELTLVHIRALKTKE